MTRKQLQNDEEINPRLFVDSGALKGLLQTLISNVLEEEVSRHLAALPYERCEGRKGQRNGHKPRTMNSPVGKLHFEVPQVREGGFAPEMYERWQRSDRAIVVAVQEMYVKGVSTRKVSEVLEKLGGATMSASQVSRCAQELDEQIKQWRGRPLAEKSYPALVIDARYEKMRNHRGNVVSQAVLVVTGVADTGRREVLGVWLGDSESEATWGEAFSELKARGLKGAAIIVSDAHKGIQSALSRHFQGCLWQRCKVHWMREGLKKVGWRDYKELARDLRSIFSPDEGQQCRAVALEVAERWRSRHPRLAAWIEESIEQCLAVWALPSCLRKRLNSTNMIERLMQELKRRSRVVGIFPNEASLMRLMAALLIEIDEKWACEDRVYLSPDALKAVEMTS